jgi:hypothetical protein
MINENNIDGFDNYDQRIDNLLLFIKQQNAQAVKEEAFLNYHNKNITDCLCARDVSIYQGKAHQITLKWDFYESLSDIYAFLEIPDFPFYNVKIYPEQNQFTVVVGDGYKAKSERTFPRIDMAVEYAEKEFLKMANADKDYEVKVGR